MSIYDNLMSEKIDCLTLALSKAQGQIENVFKDKLGAKGNYKYADLASCLDTIKGPLKDNGLAVSQLISETQDNKKF